MLTGNGNTQVLASVIGGRDPGYDNDLEALSPSSSSMNSFQKDSKEHFNGIKVTTNVTQKSVSQPKISLTDVTESTKELV